jgi:hypothetical protein
VQALRAANDDIIIEGNTNLPDGTQIGVELVEPHRYAVQDLNIFVTCGKFHSAGLRLGTSPIKPGKESIHILSLFNSFWQSPEILNLLGDKGTNLRPSKVLISEDPQMIDSYKELDYTLSVIIPPLIGVTPSDDDPIEIVKNATLIVDGRAAKYNVDDEARRFFATHTEDYKIGRGWSATPIALNEYNVALDFIDTASTQHHVAIWEVETKTRQVLYRNRNAKVISSYSP